MPRIGLAVPTERRQQLDAVLDAGVPWSMDGVRGARYLPFHVQTSQEVAGAMAIHLTPTELARETGMERRDVIEKCMELGVTIFQGRIDKTLFLAGMNEQRVAIRTRDPIATA
jgi:hypothetical protein